MLGNFSSLISKSKPAMSPRQSKGSIAGRGALEMRVSDAISPYITAGNAAKRIAAAHIEAAAALASAAVLAQSLRADMALAVEAGTISEQDAAWAESLIGEQIMQEFGADFEAAGIQLSV